MDAYLRFGEPQVRRPRDPLLPPSVSESIRVRQYSYIQPIDGMDPARIPPIFAVATTTPDEVCLSYLWASPDGTRSIEILERHRYDHAAQIHAIRFEARQDGRFSGSYHYQIGFNVERQSRINIVHWATRMFHDEASIHPERFSPAVTLAIGQVLQLNGEDGSHPYEYRGRVGDTVKIPRDDGILRDCTNFSADGYASARVKCAVNPTGECKDCVHYEKGEPLKELQGIPARTIPSASITEVADQAERLALSARVGDMVRQRDNGLTYVLHSFPASINTNWVIWSPVEVPPPNHISNYVSEESLRAVDRFILGDNRSVNDARSSAWDRLANFINGPTDSPSLDAPVNIPVHECNPDPLGE
jgi:hypothetical protein